MYCCKRQLREMENKYVFEVWAFEKDRSTMANSVPRVPDELCVS